MQDPQDPPPFESSPSPEPVAENHAYSAPTEPDKFADSESAGAEPVYDTPPPIPEHHFFSPTGQPDRIDDARQETTLELPAYPQYDPPPAEFSPDQLPQVMGGPPPILPPVAAPPVLARNPMDFASQPPLWTQYPEYSAPIKKKREPIRWEDFKEPITLPTTDTKILLLGFYGLTLIALGTLTEAMWDPLVPIGYKPHVAIVGTGLALAMAGLEPYLRFLWRWVYAASLALMIFWMFSEGLGFLVVLGFAGVTHLIRAVVRIYQRTQE
jgi:hypothetical protein